MTRQSLTNNPLDGLQPPAAPDRLRSRCLDAARRSLSARPRTTQRPDIWSRVWHNRPARLAWAATVLGLMLAHVVLSLPDAPRVRPAGTNLLAAAVATDPELAAVVDLDPLEPDRLPSLEETRARRGPSRTRLDVFNETLTNQIFGAGTYTHVPGASERSL